MATPKGFRHSEESKRKISEGQRRYYRWKIEREPPPVRVVDYPDERVCTKCGETKPIGEFYVKRRKLKCGLTHAFPEGRCKQCRRAGFKANYDQLKAEGRAREIWECKESKRDKEKLREYGREWAAAKRRKEGAKSNGPWKKYRENGYGEPLPIGPFAEFICKETVSNGGSVALAREIGVHERRVRDWKGETYATVSLDVVDRVLTKLGQPWRLHELYPVQEPEPMFGYFKP